MAEKHEFQLRRQAIRLWVQGVKSKDILQQIQRSRVWLSKWRKRFEQDGVQGLRSHSRRPHTTPQAYPPRIVHLIIRTRRRLVKQAVGLSGPRAIQRELHKVLGLADSFLNDHQAGLANTSFDCDAGIPGVLSETPADRDRNATRARLDVSLSRRWSQSLCLSHAELAHTGLFANHCHRQKHRYGDSSLPDHLENPRNPAVFATRQRCRLLWRLQNSAHFRTIRALVFVSGHRTDLPAGRRTRTQWRSRRIEWPVGWASLLGTPSLCLGEASRTHQSHVHPVVSDRLHAPSFGGCDTRTGTTPRTPPALDSLTTRALARSFAHYRWPTAFCSQGQARWNDFDPQRTLEGQPALGGALCVGDNHDPLSPAGYLVSAFGAT